MPRTPTTRLTAALPVVLCAALALLARPARAAQFLIQETYPTGSNCGAGTGTALPQYFTLPVKRALQTQQCAILSAESSVVLTGCATNNTVNVYSTSNCTGSVTASYTINQCQSTAGGDVLNLCGNYPSYGTTTTWNGNACPGSTVTSIIDSPLQTCLGGQLVTGNSTTLVYSNYGSPTASCTGSVPGVNSFQLNGCTPSQVGGNNFTTTYTLSGAASARASVWAAAVFAVVVAAATVVA